MTTISSSSVGTISSQGVGSGLDVNSIVTQLMAVEKQPLTRLQTTASGLQTQLSAFGQIQSLVSGLQDAAQALYSTGTFTLTNAGSSDPTTVSAGTGDAAVPGTYSIAVSRLASTQSVVGAGGAFANADAVAGTGSLTIRLGTWSADGSTFTPKPDGSDVTIPIGADASTLAQIRDKINAANAGVSATVVVDSNGARLALQSSSSGAANGFRVTVADDDGNNTDAAGLSRLAFDPAGGATGMTLAQSAGDAQATINGIAVASASNTLDKVIAGMTFTLAKTTANGQPVTVSVTRNTDAIKSAVSKFVASYNALQTFFGATTKYDASTKKAGLLQGDGTTQAVAGQVRTLVAQGSTASSTFGTLSSIGVQLQKDGSLKLDDAAFDKALQNLPELTKALSAVDTGSGTGASAANGIGKRFALWAGSLLASDGALSGKTKALQSRINANEKDQEALSDRLAATEARLRAQYTALDTTMSKANALSAYVKQQFYSTNSFGGNNNSNS